MYPWSPADKQQEALQLWRDRMTHHDMSVKILLYGGWCTNTSEKACNWAVHGKSSQLLLLLHPFNGMLSRTTWISQHEKGKPFWISMKQEMIGWQWHQLDHMQIICTSLKTNNHTRTSSLSFYRPDALPATQPTASKHWSKFFQIVQDGNVATVED